MSTNYYAIKRELIDNFEKEYENGYALKYLFKDKEELLDKLKVHIGKYTFNVFTFNDKLGNSYEEIKKQLQKDYIMYDEYNREVSLEDFIQLIKDSDKDTEGKSHYSYDKEGYRFLSGWWF